MSLLWIVSRQEPLCLNSTIFIRSCHIVEVLHRRHKIETGWYYLHESRSCEMNRWVELLKVVDGKWRWSIIQSSGCCLHVPCFCEVLHRVDLLKIADGRWRGFRPCVHSFLNVLYWSIVQLLEVVGRENPEIGVCVLQIHRILHIPPRVSKICMRGVVLG